MESLVEACSRRGRLDDPLVRQRLAQSWIEVEIFRLHNARTLARLAHGDELGSESSLVKLFWANMSQRLYDTAIAALPPDALLMPGADGAVDRGGGRSACWGRAPRRSWAAPARSSATSSASVSSDSRANRR